MPWCDDCSKYWAPSAMTPAGTCPTCGQDLSAPGSGADHGGGGDDERAPWHFKLLVAAVVLYLVWRTYQLFAG